MRCPRRGTARRRTVGAIEEELRRVGHAECFQPQVQIVAFRESDGLEQGSIQVEKAWPAEEVPPHVAECLARWSSKARRVERGIGADAVKDLDGSNQIRSLGVVRRQKRGGTGGKVKRKARHQGEKAGDAPATQYGGANPRRNQALALSKRQIVHNNLHKGMRAMETVPPLIPALFVNKKKPPTLP